LMFAMAIAVVMAANPYDVLAVVYAADYAQQGGAALVVLALGNVAFSVFAIAGTILNGAGMSKFAIAAALLTLLLAATGNLIVIPLVVESGRVLEAAAAVTGGSMLVGAIVAGLLMRRRLGAFVPPLSVARIAIATGIALAVGRVLPLQGKLMTLVECAVVGVTFLVALVA